MNSDAYQDAKWAEERDSWSEFMDSITQQQSMPRKPSMLGNLGSMTGSLTLQELNSYRYIYPKSRKICLYCRSSHGKERCPNCGASEYE